MPADSPAILVVGATGTVGPHVVRAWPMIAERTGRRVGTREITPADVRRGLEARGMARWEAEHFEEMYQLFREGRSEFVTSDVGKLLGRPPGTVEEHLATRPDLTAAWPAATAS